MKRDKMTDNVSGTSTTSLARRSAARDIGHLIFNDGSDSLRDLNSHSDEYQNEFLSFAELLSDIDILSSDTDIIRAGNSAVRTPLTERRPKKIIFSAAASILLAVFIGVMTLWPDNAGIDQSHMERHVTRIGEQKSIELEDGSTITLNTATQLLIAFSDKERKIILERGEAYFSVAPDPERLFTVDTGYRAITVMGTEFNIHKMPDKLELAVLDGMVAMHAPEESPSASSPQLSNNTSPARQYRVPAGWRAEFNVNKQSITGEKPPHLDSDYSWRSGILDFDGTPLVEVVQEFNRYSGKKILIEDASIMDLKVLATIKINRLDLALDGLEQTLPIKVTQYFDRIVLTHSE